MKTVLSACKDSGRHTWSLPAGPWQTFRLPKARKVRLAQRLEWVEPRPPATRKTWLTTPTLTCLFTTPERVHTGRPLKHKHAQAWTQVRGAPKSAQSQPQHARSMLSTHMQGWPFMFTFRNMYPGEQSILGSALVYPVLTWIYLSRSIQLTYMKLGMFTESVFQQSIPGSTNWLPNARKQTLWTRPTAWMSLVPSG